MADTTNCTHCVACDCPALPRVTFDQAVIDLMESIALQESALSHILCAETQKMKAALSMEELDLCKLLDDWKGQQKEHEKPEKKNEQEK